MILSDYLAILDIVVTVLIGFVITHIVSVRDSRTRAIKDYYIQELTGIKMELNDFYSRLFKGELTAREIIGWYSGIRNRIDNFDHAVRKTFTIYEANIAERLFFNYKNITNTSEFNTYYYRGKIEFKAHTKNDIGKNQKRLYVLIERTLYDINNVSGKDYISRKWQELKSHYFFYRISKKKSKGCACVNIFKDWLNAHKSNILVLGFVAVLTIVLLLSLKSVVKDEEDTTKQTELLQRLDSMNAVIKEISENSKVPSMVVEPSSTYSVRLKEVSSTDTVTVTGRIKSLQ